MTYPAHFKDLDEIYLPIYDSFHKIEFSKSYRPRFNGFFGALIPITGTNENISLKLKNFKIKNFQKIGKLMEL